MVSCKKTKYANKDTAEMDIKRIHGKSTREKVPVRAYLCNCGSWHLTSQQNKYFTEIAELKKEIEKLQDEIKSLKLAENKYIRFQFKKDELITAMRRGQKTQQEANHKLMKSNRELILKIVQLEEQNQHKDNDNDWGGLVPC